MEKLRKRHIQLLEAINLDFKRYLLAQLPWEERLVGIKGSRGVGKTTLLLQYIKANYGFSENALYISLDDLYFSDNRLIDFTEEFIAKGGKHLFMDEVHKYKNWSIELKNIYDSYPHLKVVFTGSSLLEILNSRSDLSRRALVYEMQGMSFREFLNFHFKSDFPTIGLEDLLKTHIDFSLQLNASTATDKVNPLREFASYLKIGYFPFFNLQNSKEDLYYKRLQEILSLIVEVELPVLRNTDPSIVNKIKQLIFIISQSVPFKPNIKSLAEKIQVTRKTLLEYIHYLEDANVFRTIHKDSFGVSLLQKPEKLFLENTNYMYAVKNAVPDKGNLRETFFLNQVSQNHHLTYPNKGDFLVNDCFLFEIGGKNKSKKQIAGLENAYIAADDISLGSEHKIPLWMFGFLY